MSGNETYIKICDNKERFKRELWAYQNLSERFRAPKLVKYYEEESTNKIVLTKVCGRSLKEIELRKQEILEGCAKLLHLFHTEFNNRDIDKKEIRSDIIYCSDMNGWRRTLINRVDDWIKNVRFFSKTKLIELIESDMLTYCTDGVINVIHADYLLQNIMSSEGGYYLVDFENIFVGDVDYDISKFILVETGVETEEGELFIQAYEKESNRVISRSKLKLYAAIHAIAALSWIDKNGCQDVKYESSVRGYLGTYINKKN